MSTYDRGQQLRYLLAAAVGDQIFPGASVAVVTPDQTEYISVGQIRYDQDSPPVSEHTVYDVASVTKSVATSTVALQLVASDLLHLDQYVVEILPEISGQFTQELTVRHLLTFTAPFMIGMAKLKDLAPDQILDKVYAADLAAQPGTEYAYINVTSIILGLVIEAVTGSSLDALFGMQVAQPLQMSQTSFSPDADQVVAPSEIDDWRGGEVCGQVHDESAWKLRPKVVGSAGLFSTAYDLSLLVQMMLNKGQAAGHQILPPELIQALAQDQFPSIDQPIGLGWELNRNWMGSVNHTSRCVGKTGFTGCSVLTDFDNDFGVVLLSNMIYPHRPLDRTTFDQFRSQVHSIIRDTLS